MSNPVTIYPAFQDGIASVLDSIITNQNLGVDYLYADDSIGEEAKHEAHLDPAGQSLGSHTQASGMFKGPLNFQLLNASDAVPRPGNVLTLRGAYYKVTGNIGPKRVKNKVIMTSVPVENVINPVLTTCLSALGQILTDTVASGGGSYTKTIASANVRTGATKAFSLAAWTEEYPAAVVPAGMTINATTGIITFTTPGAGTYYIKILLKDTAAAAVPVLPDRTGVGFLILTVT